MALLCSDNNMQTNHTMALKLAGERPALNTWPRLEAIISKIPACLVLRQLNDSTNPVL
jgi:hypothetical protein